VFLTFLLSITIVTTYLSETPGQEVTEILGEWCGGDRSAAERLFPLVYDELKRQARNYLNRERSDHTLQPTALVHEAYLRLVDLTVLRAENRTHFFGIAARLMRQILVDHARQRKAQKRGGSAQRFSVGEIEDMPEQSAGDLLQLNDALERLEKIDGRKSRVVDMRFFGGMKENEIAEVLAVSEKTVRRDWHFAKLWLYRELSRT
jgi:RNA polymerase sigma factor (TIGR02999 family)